MLLTRTTRRDRLWALVAALIALAVGLSSLTLGLPFASDDHSAYIAEGIAIANGTLKEQEHRNWFAHQGELPEGARDGRLLYVWGFPLMLSAVYRATGSRHFGADTVYWYKLPGLICYALLAGALVLLYRRRFPLPAAFLLALIFCADPEIFTSLNHILSDLPFLALSVLALLLAEMFVTHLEDGPGGPVCAVAFGVVMWGTCETRLSGMTVCLVCLLGQVVCLAKRQVKLTRRNAWLHALPWLLLAALRLISEGMLGTPTSNMGDFARISLSRAIHNAVFYGSRLLVYLSSIPGRRVYLLGAPLLLFFVIGFFTHGIRENLHLTLLLAGTLVVDCLLPYIQGMRYLFNVLPIVLMYTAYGAQWVFGKIRPRLPVGDRALRRALCALTVAALAIPYANIAAIDARNLRASRRVENVRDEHFTPEAVELYGYIRENTPEDAVFAAVRSRALALNTDRLCFRNNRNGHTLAEADYVLEQKKEYGDAAREMDPTQGELVFENDWYALYRQLR